jgi:hypothetical protein
MSPAEPQDDTAEPAPKKAAVAADCAKAYVAATCTDDLQGR